VPAPQGVALWQRSREAGYDHHDVKPLDPSQLLRLIEALPPRAIDLDPQI